MVVKQWLISFYTYILHKTTNKPKNHIQIGRIWSLLCFASTPCRGRHSYTDRLHKKECRTPWSSSLKICRFFTTTPFQQCVACNSKFLGGKYGVDNYLQTFYDISSIMASGERPAAISRKYPAQRGRWVKQKPGSERDS